MQGRADPLYALQAAAVYAQRHSVAESAHVDLSAVHRIDERLAACLDGMTVVSEDVWVLCGGDRGVLDRAELFTVTVCALQSRDDHLFDRLIALAGDNEVLLDSVTDALTWLPSNHVRHQVERLLGAEEESRRAVGIATCANRGLDPGLHDRRVVSTKSGLVRQHALRAVGQLGHLVSRDRCLAAAREEESSCSFWGAWAAVLLGDSSGALQRLATLAQTVSQHRARAFRLCLQAMSLHEAHSLLQEVAATPAASRCLIHGGGINGDPSYVPWLIGNMAAPEFARLAGESFSLITGADLDALQLWRPRPEAFESGPTDDPDDADVDMDPDEGLIWPDHKKVEAWWAANAHHFQKGQRYFMGKPVTREHCIDVLKNGYQRQRILAAHYLCLLNPGTPLFNTSAPAWRQQRLLAQMQ